jgi:hypothetical protein
MLKFMLDKCTYANIPMNLGSLMLQNDIGMPKFDVMLSQPHFGVSVRVKPALPKVGSWSPESRKLRARLQGSNLLAFECS